MATLNVPATRNYSIVPFNNQVNGQNITNINFTAQAVATFSSDQFGAPDISNAVAIAGSGNPPVESNQISILIEDGALFSAAGWTFTNWQGTDFITFNGSGLADAITGTSQNDHFVGGGGADLLAGGNGEDVFTLNAGDLVAGESIDGGGGTTDFIVATADNDFDFRTATLFGLEILSLRDNTSARFFGSQIGAGAITSVLGNIGVTEVIVDGADVDLSAVTFVDWSSEDIITINGSSASSNTLIGSNRADTINGGPGSIDVMTGGRGGDILNGGGGNDVFRYLDSNDVFTGETINGGSGTDTLVMRTTDIVDFSIASISSIEAIRFELGASTAIFDATQVSGVTALSGGVGNDNLVINGSLANLSAWTVSDWDTIDRVTLNGTSGVDVLTGSSVNDAIEGGDGSDTLSGGGGSDFFRYASPDHIDADQVNGAAGNDRIVVNGLGSFNFTTASLTSIEGLQFSSTDATFTTFSANQFGAGVSNALAVTGDAFANRINVNLTAPGSFSAAGWTFSNWTPGPASAPNDLTLFAGSNGADIITGSSVADQIEGGGGADQLSGGLGDDNFILRGADVIAGETMDGGGGGDAMTIAANQSINISLAAVNSIESLRLNSNSSATLLGSQFGVTALTVVDGNSGVQSITVNGAVVDLSGVTFTDWTFGEDLVTVNGTVGADFLIASFVSDEVIGGDGGDVILGLGGADILNGGLGGDHLFGGTEGDALTGGDGFDFIRYDGAASGVNVRLDFHAGFTGEAAGDLIAADVEGIVGSLFADILVGDGADNQIFGSSGDDFIYGLGGVDALFGDAGADLLYGGAGLDLMVGGGDADTFVVAASDLATNVFDYAFDFQDGLDAIVLEGWNPASLLTFESGGHVFVTSADFGFSSGLIVLNATLAQVQDQVFVV